MDFQAIADVFGVSRQAVDYATRSAEWRRATSTARYRRLRGGAPIRLHRCGVCRQEGHRADSPDCPGPTTEGDPS
jgi:hypothetical protein